MQARPQRHRRHSGLQQVNNSNDSMGLLIGYERQQLLKDCQ